MPQDILHSSFAKATSGAWSKRGDEHNGGNTNLMLDDAGDRRYWPANG